MSRHFLALFWKSEFVLVYLRNWGFVYGVFCAVKHMEMQAVPAWEGSLLTDLLLGYVFTGEPRIGFGD